MRNPLHHVLRAMAPLALIATGVLLTTGPADAAGVPPTVVFDFLCNQDGTPLTTYTVTNNDLGEHALVVTVLPDGPTFPSPLAVGQTGTGGATLAADGEARGWEVAEDGVVLATSPILVADASVPGCWSEPQDQVPVEPAAPTVTVEPDCGGAFNEVEVTVFSDDPFAHDVVVTLTELGSGQIESVIDLDALQTSENHVFVVGDGPLRFVVTENGVTLHDTGFFVFDDSADDCIAPFQPQAPSVTFGSHCDDGGVTLDVDYVNNDLGPHDLVVLLTTIGVGTQEITTPSIPVGEAVFATDHFVPFGLVVQLVVKEGDTVLGQSPLWETTAAELDCTKAPDLVPIVDVPPDEPTNAPNPTPRTPQPAPTTTTTTTSVPEATTSTTVAAPAPEPVAAPVVVPEDVKAPAPEVTFQAFAAPVREALPRTGSSSTTLGLVGWLMIVAGVVVKRAAARRA